MGQKVWVVSGQKVRVTITPDGQAKFTIMPDTNFLVGGIYAGSDLGPQFSNMAITYRTDCTYIAQTRWGFFECFISAQNNQRTVLWKYLGDTLTRKVAISKDRNGQCRFCHGTKKVQLFNSVVACTEPGCK